MNLLERSRWKLSWRRSVKLITGQDSGSQRAGHLRVGRDRHLLAKGGLHAVSIPEIKATPPVKMIGGSMLRPVIAVTREAIAA